jgi:hypothetical protein
VQKIQESLADWGGAGPIAARGRGAIGSLYNKTRQWDRFQSIAGSI